MGISRLNLKAVVSSRGDVGSHLRKPNDAVLVSRGEPRWLILSCPCGCGEQFPINLDPRSGKAWRIYNAGRKDMTVFPSVWRDTGCQSHYIIWRGQVHFFGRSFEEEGKVSLELGHLMRPVLQKLSASTWRSFIEVADELGEIPWDVLDVCRDLVRAGNAEEGEGKLKSHFRLGRSTAAGRPASIRRLA